MKFFTTKRLFQIHGWVGLNLGLLLFIICFSGTIAVFSHEIDWLLNPDIRVKAESEKASWGTLVENVQAAHPDSELRFMYGPRGARFAQETVIRTPAGQMRRVYTNPYTGEVQGDTSYFNIQRFFRSFHRRMFIGDPWYMPDSLYVVCFFGFVLLFSAVTGLLFYKKWWRHLFRLRWDKSRRVFWSDLHRLVGVWTLLFAVMIALTGVWYFVEMGLFDLDMNPDPAPRLTASPPGADAERLPVDELVAVAEEAYPALTIRQIWFPAARKAPLMIRGQADAWLVRDRVNAVAVDPYHGEVLGVRRGEDLAALPRWTNTADPLHFGNFGGLVTKAIWFVLGLALSLSILAGAYIWHLRVQAQARPHRPGIGEWTAMGLTAGLLIAATCHTYTGILDYGPASDGTIAPETPMGVILFIAGFVVLSVVILVAWYWVILQKLARRQSPAVRRSHQAREVKSPRDSSVQDSIVAGDAQWDCAPGGDEPDVGGAGAYRA